jgi:hypothetical protein
MNTLRKHHTLSSGSSQNRALCRLCLRPASALTCFATCALHDLRDTSIVIAALPRQASAPHSPLSCH